MENVDRQECPGLPITHMSFFTMTNHRLENAQEVDSTCRLTHVNTDTELSDFPHSPSRRIVAAKEALIAALLATLHVLYVLCHDTPKTSKSPRITDVRVSSSTMSTRSEWRRWIGTAA